MILQLTASLESQPTISSYQVINVIRSDSTDVIPAFLSNDYHFHVFENSVSGQRVGQMEVTGKGHANLNSLNYQLVGPGSEM